LFKIKPTPSYNGHQPMVCQIIRKYRIVQRHESFYQLLGCCRLLSDIYNNIMPKKRLHLAAAPTNVDCSGERLTCVPKNSGFWNRFSYNIPDRKVGFYLISNFENKFVINLCTRLKLFWYQLVGSIRFVYKLKSTIVNKWGSYFREHFWNIYLCSCWCHFKYIFV
jgi:hypothetical protein